MAAHPGNGRNAGASAFDAAADVVEQVVLEAKYAGYIDRQAAQVERFQRLESRPIPAHFDFAAVPQLRAEAKEKLSRIRPASLGQAGRISGISPADLAVLADLPRMRIRARRGSSAKLAGCGDPMVEVSRGRPGRPGGRRERRRSAAKAWIAQLFHEWVTKFC